MKRNRQTVARLADLHYNRGLAAATDRDMTAAVTELSTALTIRRDHTQARDLLGLVYYETGQAARALEQWIISRELDPAGELSARYIDDMQHDAGRLRAMESALVRYNRALHSCRSGHDDAAAVELRRSLTQNPKLLVAWQLLALVEAHRGRLTQAERMLRRAAAIDIGSGLTQHLKKLVSGERGTQEERRGRVLPGRKKEKEEGAIRNTGNRRSFLNTNLFNILIGAAVGIMGTWALLTPAKVRETKNEMNARIVEYTNTVTEQKEQIGILQDRVATLQQAVADAEEASETSERRAKSYRGLLNVYKAYGENDIETAGRAVLDIDESLLDDEALAIYNEIKGPVTAQAYDMFSEEGLFAFDGGNFSEAIPLLEMAVSIRNDDYITLNRLAHAYRYTNDPANALKYFQAIVDTFPDSPESESVQGYLEEMKNALSKGTAEEEP